MNDKPLCLLHPVLYDLCEDKLILVHLFVMKHGQLSFSRWLPTLLFEEWLGIVNTAYSYPFENSRDVISWRLHKSGVFLVKSVYNHLSKSESGHHYKRIWMAKIPYKVKIFLWLVENNAILTKDNLLKRKWTGDPSCYFCSSPETVGHLLFQCPIAKIIWGTVGVCIGANNIPNNTAQFKNWMKIWLPRGEPVYVFIFAAISWSIWKGRNKTCFEHIALRNPVEIITHACAFMSYWVGLYASEMQNNIMEGFKLLPSCAHKVMVQTNRPAPLLLPAIEVHSEDEDSTGEDA